MRRSILILLLISFQSGIAQTHQWAQFFRTIGGSSTAYSLSTDSKGNVYMVGEMADSLYIDSQVISDVTTKNKRDAFFVKLNSMGKLMWCNILNGTMMLRHVQTVSDDKILIYGFCTGNGVKFTKNDSLINTGGSFAFTGFVAIYDSSGKFLSAIKTYMGKGYGSNNNAASNFDNGEFTLDTRGCLYLTFYKDYFTGSINYIGGSIALKDTIAKDIVVKYSPGLDSILWYREFPQAESFQVTRIRAGEDDNLYLACHVGGANFSLDGKAYRYQNYSDKGFMSILSPKGTFIHNSLINVDSTQKDNLYDIGAKDTNNIYIIGYVEDSIFYRNKWYASLNKKAQKTIYKHAFPYMGLVGLSKGAKWIKLPVVRGHLSTFNPHKTGFTSERLSFDRSGHIYAAFNVGDSVISIGGLSYKVPLGGQAFVKFDKMGNALWIKYFKLKIRDIVATPDSNLVFTGDFVDEIFIDPFEFKKGSSSVRGHTFIAKTDDYAIIREFVAPGPYCAGDTFNIPYYRFGKYDTSNYFIAELSDESGNFDGGERELGRLKTTRDGTVKCTIPLFKVSSSWAYRIRIRSTSPAVQSFYKRDTLQLLIYSRDKADPGLPETICRGDSIKLNTYGGTKWTWSPKYNMDNSTKRQPIVWPMRDTVYRIIIADSSGCGKPDTAFKKITIRPYPKSTLKFNDTIICGDPVLKIPVSFQGGDSNYSWQWFFVFSSNSWFPSVKGNLKMNDTLSYSPTEPYEKLALVLKDGCTAKPDTAYLTISKRKPVVLINKLRDTTVCSGHILKYKAMVTGGVTKYLKYQWKDLLSNTVLSTADSLKFTISKTLKIQLIVNDGCEVSGDTAEFKVEVKAELKAISNLRDTTICFGQTINLSAKATGGNSAAYSYSWLLDKKVISTSANYLLKTEDHFKNSASTSILTLILKDNCSAKPDTIKKTITVKPSPRAGFSFDLACSRTVTKFQFTGTKPLSPITTAFKWNFNNEATSTLENPSHKFAAAGISTSILTLISSSGCTDTLKKTFEIKPQSLAGFSTSDVCENDSAVFINQSQDATSYTWKFGDGQKSSIGLPKHLYKTNGVTTTFNVTLVAQVTNGCSDSISKAITVNANPNSGFSYTTAGFKVDLKATQSGLSKYRWKFENTDSVTTTTSAYTHTLKTGQKNVCLKVTDLAGCTSETCKNVTLGISGIEKQNLFTIYPNPTNGILYIQTPDNSGHTVSVWNTSGQKVFGSEINPVGRQIELDLKNDNMVSSGIYFIQVKNSKASQVFRLLVY